MPASDRLASEQAFHDQQASARARTWAEKPNALRVDVQAYLDHESWIRPAMERLGDVRGKRVLDYGCGHAMSAVVLAHQGACVTAFDLSRGYLTEARRRAYMSEAEIAFVQADGARLPFADHSFDRIWGNAILHHLEIAEAGKELRRVLRPGSVAVFCEPWGGNPLLNLARRRLPYPGKHRTRDEEPLKPANVRALRTIFERVDVRGVQLVSMARRVLRRGRLVHGLDTCDTALLTKLPLLQRFCRYVILTLER